LRKKNLEEKENPEWICKCGGLRKRIEKTLINIGSIKDITLWQCMLCGEIERGDNKE